MRFCCACPRWAPASTRWPCRSLPGDAPDAGYLHTHRRGAPAQHPGDRNAAYETRTDTIVRVLKQGDDLALALTRAGGFNGEFLQIIAVGEESGRLPEVLKNQAKFYEEESERRLTFLTKAASWGVWLVVAAFMIYMMYRIFTTSIAPAYNM